MYMNGDYRIRLFYKNIQRGSLRRASLFVPISIIIGSTCFQEKAENVKYYTFKRSKGKKIRMW